MTKITRLEAWACRSPITEPVTTSFGTMQDRPAVFLRLEDDHGGVGWGEIFANWPAAGAEHRVNLMADDIAALVLGQPADRPADLFRDLEDRSHIRALQCGEFGPFRQVLAGIDQALWDMQARDRGLALHQALGGSAAAHVPAYASGIHIAAAPRMIPEARALGFSRFKVKIGFDRDRDIARLREVVSGLEPGETLLLDANQAWDAAQAEDFLDRIADLPVGWMEEPIRADRPAGDWQRLRGRIPLAAGENIAGMAAYRAALDQGVLTYYQPDIAKWGGFSGCLDVARAVLAAGKTYCPHFLGGGIGLIGSAELLAAAGGPGLLEVDVNPNPLRDGFVALAEQVQAGNWHLGTAPGLGIETLPAPVMACVTHHRIARS